MSKYAIITDLNRCTGCLACTVACKAINGVDVGNFWIKTLRIGPNPISDEKFLPKDASPEVVEKFHNGTLSYPYVEMYFLPVQCQHCFNPECVKVCPTEASHVREDGTIQIDKSKCIGCQFCAMACPYGVRYLNEEERVVEKCTMCEQRISQGELPQCVAQCGARARFFGDLGDDADYQDGEDMSKRLYEAVADFEAPAHPDNNDCQYDQMTKTRVKLKDYVEAFEKEDIHHLTNAGNDPKIMYLLRQTPGEESHDGFAYRATGRKWRG